MDPFSCILRKKWKTKKTIFVTTSIKWGKFIFILPSKNCSILLNSLFSMGFCGSWDSNSHKHDGGD